MHKIVQILIKMTQDAKLMLMIVKTAFKVFTSIMEQLMTLGLTFKIKVNTSYIPLHRIS